MQKHVDVVQPGRGRHRVDRKTEVLGSLQGAVGREGNPIVADLPGAGPAQVLGVQERLRAQGIRGTPGHESDERHQRHPDGRQLQEILLASRWTPAAMWERFKAAIL